MKATPFVSLAKQGPVYFLTLMGLVSISFWAGSALAQVTNRATDGDTHPRGRHGPPAGALAVCESMAAGDNCGFSDDRGSHQGKCWSPADKPLACRPNDHPHHKHDKPHRLSNSP